MDTIRLRSLPIMISKFSEVETLNDQWDDPCLTVMLKCLFFRLFTLNYGHNSLKIINYQEKSFLSKHLRSRVFEHRTPCGMMTPVGLHHLCTTNTLEVRYRLPTNNYRNESMVK